MQSDKAHELHLQLESHAEKTQKTWLIMFGLMLLIMSCKWFFVSQ